MISRLWNIDLKVGSNTPVPVGSDQQLADILNRSDINRQLLIVGPCGSGKTSTLLELSRQLLLAAEGDISQPIPVMIDINSLEVKRRKSWYANEWLANKDASGIREWVVRSWIADAIEEKYEIEEDLIEDILHKKLILPLVDDFDKIDLEFQCLWIPIINNTFSNKDKYPGFVLSSRRDKYPFPDGRPQLNGTLYLQALTDRQIQDCLISYQCDQFWNAFQANPEFLSISRKPQYLNLAILALQTQNHSFLETLSSKDQIEDFLYSTYISWKISELSTANHTYEIHKIDKWTTWMSCHLSRNSETTFSVANLQPSDFSTESEKNKFKQLTSRVRTPLLLTLSSILLFWSLYLFPLRFPSAQNPWMQFFLSVFYPILPIIILSPLLFSGNKYVTEDITIRQRTVPSWLIIYMFGLCGLFYWSIYDAPSLLTALNFGLVIVIALSVIAFVTISISDGFKKTLVETMSFIGGLSFFVKFISLFRESLMLRWILFFLALIIYNWYAVDTRKDLRHSSKAWKGVRNSVQLFLASASFSLALVVPLIVLNYFLTLDFSRLLSIIPSQTFLRPNPVAAFVLPSFGLFIGIIGSLKSGEFALFKHLNVRTVLDKSGKFPFDYRGFLKDAAESSLLVSYRKDSCRFYFYKIQTYLTRRETERLKKEILISSGNGAHIKNKLNCLHSLMKYWRSDLSILHWLNTANWSREEPDLQSSVVDYFTKCVLEVNLRRAQIYLELKNYQASLKYLNQLIRYMPDCPSFFALRSKVYAESSQYERASNDIDKAIELVPNSYEYLTLKSRYCEKLQDGSSSMYYAFEALKQHKSSDKTKMVKLYIQSRKEDSLTALYLTQIIQSEKNTLFKETMISELARCWGGQPSTLSFLKRQSKTEQIPSTQKVIARIIRKLERRSSAI